MRQEIIDKVKAAGVIGAGGAGFPTHVKLDAKVDMALANGASCEPLLMSDPYLMENEAESILRGLKAVMTATGAARGRICLKTKHGKALDRLGQAAASPECKGIEIFELKDFYPAGDEQVLVYEVTGRIVPEGGLPLQVGAVVSNVESLLNIDRALAGHPVTHRYLTVTGEVNRPLNLAVPIGTSFRDVVQLAGGPAIDDFKAVIGGPMMGRVVDDLDGPVTKTTSGIIILPAGHNVVAGKVKDPDRVMYITRVACCQCSRCTDQCPRHLLGHSLAAHKIMRQLGSPGGLGQEVMQDALICSECGICEKFSCPMMISPREVNARIKKELLAKGIKRTAGREDYQPSAFREVRYLPTSRLMERLRVGRYDGHPEFYQGNVAPAVVSIPLRQHIGAPALAVVTPGTRVKKGDVIGEIPEDALSARVHASIDGEVVSVADQVVIKA